MTTGEEITSERLVAIGFDNSTGTSFFKRYNPHGFSGAACLFGASFHDGMWYAFICSEDANETMVIRKLESMQDLALLYSIIVL